MVLKRSKGYDFFFVDVQTNQMLFVLVATIFMFACITVGEFSMWDDPSLPYVSPLVRVQCCCNLAVQIVSSCSDSVGSFKCLARL